MNPTNITPDNDRLARCGIPEIIYGEIKTDFEIFCAMCEILKRSKSAIATRVSREKSRQVTRRLEDYKNENGIECSIRYDDISGVMIAEIKEEIGIKGEVEIKSEFENKDEVKNLIENSKINKNKITRKIGILTAGTSDARVAREAEIIAKQLGCEVYARYDVGIAGIHRVFDALEEMSDLDIGVYIVVAGMEGALPSVVAGLVREVVIGVPTSVGYGTGKGGTAALNTMLNSCTPVCCVNIDNGLGAALIAYKILKGRQ